MSTDRDRVRAYYGRFGEWERLETPEGALELRRACALLHAQLLPGSRVLDLGGGPGRYAIELARRGHRVVLADLSPELLATARQRVAEAGAFAGSVESFDEVNAVDLGRYVDQSFDAVVAFGPFYHLLAEQERSAAAREIARVVGARGLVFVAFIPWQSGVIALVERASAWPEQVPEGVLTRAVTTGTFRNGSGSGFQEGYYPRIDELVALFDEAGFEVQDVVSLRSIGHRLEAKCAGLAVPIAREVERLMDELGRDPAIIATGGHAVLVAQKR